MHGSVKKCCNSPRELLPEVCSGPPEVSWEVTFEVDEQLEGKLRRGASWMTAEDEPVTVTAASRPSRRGECVCVCAVLLLLFQFGGRCVVASPLCCVVPEGNNDGLKYVKVL